MNLCVAYRIFCFTYVLLSTSSVVFFNGPDLVVLHLSKSIQIICQIIPLNPVLMAVLNLQWCDFWGFFLASCWRPRCVFDMFAIVLGLIYWVCTDFVLWKLQRVLYNKLLGIFFSPFFPFRCKYIRISLLIQSRIGILYIKWVNCVEVRNTRKYIKYTQCPIEIGKHKSLWIKQITLFRCCLT